jgi:hypothetical protein
MPGRAHRIQPSLSRRLRASLATVTAVAATALVAQSAAAPPASAAAGPAAARPGGGLITQAQAVQQARASGNPVEVTAATTPDSTLKANPDGTLTLTQESVPVRKRVAGKWLPLDATLARTAGGLVSPAVTTSGLRLSGGGTGPLAVMTDNGDSLALTAPFPLPAPILSGATATYPAVLPGVDLQVTADDQGGFSEVLVVKNAAAAADPRLRSLVFATKVSGGIRLDADSAGNVTAVTAGGRVVFSAPAPREWDSTAPATAVPTVTIPATGQHVDQRSGQPATSTPVGPGERARTGPVAVTIHGTSLALTPDPAILSGPATRYPVYIDPTYAAGSVNQGWTMVNSLYNTTSYWDSGTYGLIQVGDQGWSAPYFVARGFVQESVPATLDDATIFSSTVYFTDEYAPSCDTNLGNFGFQVWLTGGINSGTDWSNQPGWSAYEDGRAFAHGYNSSCPAASEGFNVTSAMQSAVASGWPNVTLGLRATNESDPYGWKQFSPTVTMTTTYDHAPATPTALTTSPATSCSASSPTIVGNGEVILYAGVSDPDGGALSATFNAYNTATNATIDIAGVPVNSNPVTATSGTTAALLIPQSDLDAAADGAVTEFSWYVTVSDGTLSSGQSATCNFSFDPTTPGTPSVAACQGSAQTIGAPVGFAVTPNSSGTTPASYEAQLNGEAPVSFNANSSGDATVTVTPTRFADVLTVVALSAGGNVGAAFVCNFTAAAPSPGAADGDLTGDGIPDLITPGGPGTGLPAGLWLAAGQTTGQVNPAASDIGAEGDGILGFNGTTEAYSPTEFTGAQVISGAFTDDGLQDVLAYYPAGTYAGQAVIIAAPGDGSVLDTRDTSDTTGISATTFTATDPNGDIPLQVANGYNADPNDSPAYPDLITISGDAVNGYYLEYYQNAGTTGSYFGSIPLTTSTPDGTMDWNNWTIATMAGTAGAADMFLYDASTGALWLWQNLTINDTSTPPSASYTAYQLATSWNPGTLTELRAATISSGPVLWAVTTAGIATSWTITGLPGTPAITAGPAQPLITPGHSWSLADSTASGTTVTTAADNTAGTPLPLTGNAGTTWNTSDPVYSPDITLNGTTGYLTPPAATIPATADTPSLSLWFKTSTANGVLASLQQQAFSAGPSSSYNPVLYIGSDGHLNAEWWNGTASPIVSASPVDDGQWHHAVLTTTFTGGTTTQTLTLDGKVQGTATGDVDLTWASTTNLTFGAGYFGGSWPDQPNPGQSPAVADYYTGQLADVTLSAPASTVTVTSPGNQTGAVGTPASLQISAADSTAGQTLAYTATGLPAGLTINSSSGLISGTPTATATAAVTVTAFDSAGEYGSASFTWTIGGCASFVWQATTVFTANMGFTNCQGTLVMQADGNLVLYNENWTAIWATNTSGHSGASTVFQDDGNLVVYTSSGVAIWASNTDGKAPGGYFVYQSDGNLVIYNSAWQAVWASNTDRG